MKTIVTIAISLFMAAAAQADQQIMKDKATANLAKALKGHALVCELSSKKLESAYEKNFFPITITATEDATKHETLLKVETKDPKVGFGYGGREFDATEETPTWFIISEGDDGRRRLIVEKFELGETDQCAKGGTNIAGIVSEIWDAGTNEASGVMCCIK